jgi:hypothetical protein
LQKSKKHLLLADEKAGFHLSAVARRAKMQDLLLLAKRAV